MLTNILKFLEIVPPEITVALIGVLSAVVSAHLSMCISKTTSLAEISAEKEKREEIWYHEHETAYNAGFASSSSIVT